MPLHEAIFADWERKPASIERLLHHLTAFMSVIAWQFSLLPI
jgi:hypothetical protein